ncbi:MAG: thermonuclease family protein [Rhodospirillales bacterium]|nr:thermonuclease family protein [Rhodospirillales bacterium]
MPLRTIIAALALSVSASLAASEAVAHGGGLDPLGCHHNTKKGGYHCHRGPLADRSFGTQREAFEALRKLQSSSLEMLRATLAAVVLRASNTFTAASPIAAQQLVGVASVIDGDTIEIHYHRVRLHGIDAPESRQLCTANGKEYRCGQKAINALSGFIGRRTVSCELRDTDLDGGAVAVCLVGGQDLAAWMVSRGYALAYRTETLDYVPAEESAAAAKAGIWAGEFEAPWEWRTK